MYSYILIDQEHEITITSNEPKDLDCCCHPTVIRFQLIDLPDRDEDVKHEIYGANGWQDVKECE